MNDEHIAPECGPTLERIQSVLDRIHPAAILSADAHPEVCPACRDRVRAAQRMLELFAEPARIAATPRFTESVLAAVQTDHRVRFRRRAFAVFGGLAAAAAIAVAVWLNSPKHNEFAKQVPPPAPVPQQPAPVPPIRVNEEFARASDAIRESTRSLTEPAANAPRMVASLTETLLKTPTVPVSYDLGPAGKSLADIPDAAKSGLEPVGNTAQKAFNRLLRDVTGMKPKT